MKIWIVFIIIIVWNIIIVINKKRRYKKVVEKNIEIFNLGSSHSYFAFNYNVIKNKKCVNLANPSQTFYYDYKILNHYFDKLADAGKCFLTISYFSFAGKERWLIEDLITYFKVLKLKDFNTLEEKVNYIIFNYIPIVWSVKKKYLKIKNKSASKKKDRIQGHKNMLVENRNLKYNLDILDKIISKCKEKNIEVILVTTPFTEYYNNYFNKELLNNNFYKILDEIIERYNLEYIDLSHNYSKFTEKEFDDYDHLSRSGSVKFMNYLIENNWI